MRMLSIETIDTGASDTCIASTPYTDPNTTVTVVAPAEMPLSTRPASDIIAGWLLLSSTMNDVCCAPMDFILPFDSVITTCSFASWYRAGIAHAMADSSVTRTVASEFSYDGHGDACTPIEPNLATSIWIVVVTFWPTKPTVMWPMPVLPSLFAVTFPVPSTVNGAPSTTVYTVRGSLASDFTVRDAKRSSTDNVVVVV